MSIQAILSPFLIGLDQCINDIRETRCHTERASLRICSKNHWQNQGFFVPATILTTEFPSLCKSLLNAEKWVGARLSISITISAFPSRMVGWIRNPISRILVVCIGIHYYISSEHQTMHGAMVKCDSQTTISLELYDMMQCPIHARLLLSCHCFHHW